MPSSSTACSSAMRGGGRGALEDERHVDTHAQVREQAGLLKHIAQRAATTSDARRARRRRHTSTSTRPDRPDALHADDGAQAGGLARARGAKQRVMKRPGKTSATSRVKSARANCKRAWIPGAVFMRRCAGRCPRGAG